MCDTVVIVQPERVLFAKNSDRDPNEGQALEWHPAESYAAGAMVECTWITIPQVRETYPTLLSRPYWMWGAEMGSNGCGVVIGNEAVFTKELLAKTGLTGMDLVRLGLERGETARRACEIIIELIETHGQGGGCGHENRAFSYHNSFLIADGREAYLLETAGKHHVIDHVTGIRTISNGLSIPAFSARFGDPLRTGVSQCALRSARTAQLVTAAPEVGGLFALLRDHGAGCGVAPRYRWVNGAMGGPCMHAGGLVAASQTTASWVSELGPAGAQHWVTATAAPCTSLFKPVEVEAPLACALNPGERMDESLWWRHEAFHREVMKDPESLVPLFREERDAVEAAWLESPPDSAEAFARHDALLREWTAALAERSQRRGQRPWYVERYWRIRNRWAGL